MADLKSSNTDTVVKIILVFFISLLSFSIGTFVGKKFSDNQHKLATMEPTKTDDKSSAHGEATAASSNHDAHEETLSDEQVAAMANEFVDDEAQPAQHGAKKVASAEHEEKVAAKEEKPSHEAKETKEVKEEKSTSAEKGHAELKHTSIEKPAKKESVEAHQAPSAHETPSVHETQSAHETPSVHESPSRIPSSVAKEIAAAPGAKYTIQIAAFPAEEEAQKKATELKKLNFEAFYTPATIKGQTWYRVNVGSFTTAKEAQEYKAELAEKAHISSALIQKLAK